MPKKASRESLIGFKQMANEEFSQVSAVICRLFPDLSGEQALTFLQQQLAASIGLYTMTDLSVTQKQVLEMPEFQHFQLNFADSFRLWGLKE